MNQYGRNNKIEYNKSFYVSSRTAEIKANIYSKNINKNHWSELHLESYYDALDFLGVTNEPIIVVNKNVNTQENSLIKLSFDDTLNNSIKFFLLLIDITRVCIITITAIFITPISIFTNDIYTTIECIGYASAYLIFLLLHPFIALLYIIGLTYQPCDIWYSLTWVTLSSTALLVFYLSLWTVIFGVSSSKELGKAILLSIKDTIYLLKKILF